MTKVITTREAKISTCAVEIKSLTVSGKQMTLSVCRQIQNEYIIDRDTGQLRGVPWGRINYFWGDCKPNHLHVIWQKGDELRLACVHPDAPDLLYAGERREVEAAVRRAHLAARAVACRRVLGGLPAGEVTKRGGQGGGTVRDLRVEVGGRCWILNHGNMGFQSWHLFEAVDLLDPRGDHRKPKTLRREGNRVETPEEVEARIAEAIKSNRESVGSALSEVLESLGLDDKDDVSLARLERLAVSFAEKAQSGQKVVDDLTREWQLRYDELDALQHLYIAV
jgi:hypothetical protein